MKKKETFSPEELEAASWYFAIENLGMQITPKIQKLYPNYNMIRVALQNHAGSCSESDEMYQGFIDEKNWWLKSFRKNEKGTIKMWLEEKEKLNNLVNG